MLVGIFTAMDQFLGNVVEKRPLWLFPDVASKDLSNQVASKDLSNQPDSLQKCKGADWTHQLSGGFNEGWEEASRKEGDPAVDVQANPSTVRTVGRGLGKVAHALGTAAKVALVGLAIVGACAIGGAIAAAAATISVHAIVPGLVVGAAIGAVVYVAASAFLVLKELYLCCMHGPSGSEDRLAYELSQAKQEQKEAEAANKRAERGRSCE